MDFGITKEHKCSKTYFYEIPNKVRSDLLLVPLCDVLDDHFSLLQSAIAEQPSGTLGYKPPIT